MAHLWPRNVERDKSRRIGRPGWSYRLLVAFVACAVVAIGLLKSVLAPELSNLAFDVYQRLNPARWETDSQVRIVDIDEESLARLGQWPWPRSVMAELLIRLKQLDAAVVAVDIVFAEPDASNFEHIIAALPVSPARMLLEQENAGRASNDVLLSQAITGIPTVLGAVLLPEGQPRQLPAKFGIVTAGDDPRLFLAHFTSAVAPIEVLETAAAGLGILNWLPDRDQIVRRVPLLASLGQQIVTSLPIEALRVAQGASTVIVRSSNASGHTAFGEPAGVNAVKVGDIEIPTDPQGALRVNHSSSDRRRFIPAWKLLNGDIDPGEIRGRIILVGTSAAGLRDQRSTPIDSSVAGVEIHAQVLEQILSAAWLRKPDWSTGAEVALAGLLALAFGAMLPQVSALAGAIIAILAVILVGWASRYGFTAHGLLLDPINPSLAVAATYVSCVVWLYRAEQKRRKFVYDAFGRYVSPAIVERLADNPSRLVLGGETRPLTILFCDVRDFTSIAEILDATSLAAFMNEYLTSMTDVILASGGTIDKYIGDAVMAFWNAPMDDADHAANAVQTAIAMIHQLKALNQRWTQRATARGEAHQEVGFRIGLSTGECVVGNFGSVQRFDYSALGDNVNLASRLEGANKYYRTKILASEATRQSVPNMPWLEVGAVRVKGRAEVLRIFTLAGPDVKPSDATFMRLCEVHERLLAALQRGEFANAATRAREARGLASPWVLEMYDAFEQRCRELERERPANWGPVTDLEK